MKADELKKEDKSTPFTIFNSKEYRKDQIQSRAEKLIAHSRTRSSGINLDHLNYDSKAVANSTNFEGSKSNTVSMRQSQFRFFKRLDSTEKLTESDPFLRELKRKNNLGMIGMENLKKLS